MNNVKRVENMAKLACAYAGIVWGLFWIPLRAMDEAGITGAWSTAMFYIVPVVILMPMLLWRWRQLIAGGVNLHITGMISGFSLVLYANALIHTEVVHAMLLYYLTPIWSTLLARVWLKESITGIRIVAIVLGISGILVIFGIDTGLPWPKNIGDWMGLASGMLWAVAAVRLRDDKKNKAPEHTLVYFFWGAVAAVALALIPYAGAQAAPSMDVVSGNLYWLVPVIMVIVIPSGFAVFWGTPLLSPGLVGLLFMTEISVGAATAALWAGEPFGVREVIGIVLITAAGLVESIPLPGRFKAGALGGRGGSV